VRLPFTNLQYHLLPVDHRRKGGEVVFHKMHNVTHSLWSEKKCDELPFTNVQCHSLPVGHRKKCDITAFTNVQFHSQAIGHRKRYHETTFHKKCNVTHKLLFIWKDCLSYNVHHLLPVGHRKDVMRLLHTMFNDTHSLLVIGKMWWDCLSQNVHYLLPVGHRKDVTVGLLYMMFNVTHCFLLAIWKDAMRMTFTKCALSLTPCWSQEKKWWDCLSKNVQCHSLAANHKKDVMRLPFSKIYNVTHSLLVIGKDVMRLPSIHQM